MEQAVETKVLIVGAGLTGATAAILLARHGIDTLAVSQEPWVADSPRAHIMNQRTMEVLRSIGLEDACKAAAAPAEMMANHVMATSASGPEFGRLWTWGNDPARQGEYGLASPVRGCDLPQDRLEPILVGEAARRGATVRFSTRFDGLVQDGDGVTSTLTDLVTGNSFRVRSSYVIGADGGQSAVAQAIELPFDGEAGIAPAVNVVFRADLADRFAHRPGSIFWMLQPGRSGAMGTAMLRMVEPWDRWVIGIFHLGEQVRDLGTDEVEAAIREVLGDDDLRIEIEGVYPWRINHVLAEEYGRGRVFCAGDAVHRHPPMNGLGGNTCMQDSFNLAWKLAAVLRGQAGPGLLDTYEAERKPIGRDVVDAAIAGWRQTPEVLHALGIDRDAPAEDRLAQFDELFARTDAGERRRTLFR